MNRKKMIKELKKNKKNNKEITEENYINRFIGTIFGLIIISIIGYFLVGVFLTKSIDLKKEDKKEEKTEVTIDNDVILLGNIFSLKDSSYYVLVYDKENKDSLLKNWVSDFQSNNEEKMYIVDSENKLNAKYIVEKDSNKNPTSLEDLKVKSPTLIKIEDGKVTLYIEGIEEVKNELKK